MKWIGQHIYDLASRFRNDVFLEDISTGTIASGAHLGLDSNNKIVKAVDGGGDLTSIVAGTGLSGTSLTGPIPTLNVDASIPSITTLAGLTSFGAAEATTDIVAGDVTMYNAVNDGNPTISLGSSATNRFEIKTAYNSGAQTLDEVYFNTYTTSTSSNDGRYIWQVDEVELAKLLDAGLVVFGNINANDAACSITCQSTTASSSTAGGTLAIVSNDGAAMGDDHRLGVIEFKGAEDASNTLVTGASIQAMCDAAWSASENGTRLEFYTMDRNASSELSLTLDSDLLATFAGAVTVTGALTGTLATVSQPNITGVGTIGTGVWNGTAIASAYLDTDTAHLSGAQTFTGTKTLNSFKGTGGATVTNILDEDAMGSDSATALATQQSIKAYVDAMPVKASFRFAGYGTTDGTNYEIPEIMTDTNAPFEHNTSVGADGLTALAVSLLLRCAGQVMPYAGTLKNWIGWAASSGSGTTYVSLFKYTPNPSSSSAVSLVLLDEQSFTAAGNNTVLAISQTSFTDADVAVGDIIITGVKGVNNKTVYFTSTLEVEWD